MGADKKMKKANTGLQTVDNKKIAEFVTLRKIFKCKIINEIFLKITIHHYSTTSKKSNRIVQDPARKSCQIHCPHIYHYKKFSIF